MAKQIYTKGSKFSGSLEKALIKPEKEDTEKKETKIEDVVPLNKSEKTEMDEPEVKTPVERHFSGKARQLFQERTPKYKKNSHTFYLEDDIFQELSYIAKESGRSVSDVLNEVLRNAL